MFLYVCIHTNFCLIKQFLAESNDMQAKYLPKVQVMTQSKYFCHPQVKQEAIQVPKPIKDVTWNVSNCAVPEIATRVQGVSIFLKSRKSAG